MHIQPIPLSQLVPCPANVRKTGRKSGIEGLAASIAAHGLLQNLQVRPTNGESFEVVAGGRRFDALKLLAKQKKIAPDHPVACEVRGNANDATEISLAENEMREAMHPADQFEAFKTLADDGRGEEEIAARFGVTPQVVRQRLKLAVVSPKLIAAYRKDAMTLDCLMAFTVSDDHRQQEKVWKALPDYARQSPRSIKDALTEKHAAADSRRALFVGIEAYTAAGGAVLRDLFDDGNTWHTDPALLNRLAAEKLEQAARTVRGEGWKWVEIVPELTWESTKNFGKAQSEHAPPTAAQQEEIERLTAECNAITREDGEEPEDEDSTDPRIKSGDLWEIQRRIEQLSEGDEFWPDAAKGNAGAVVGIDHDGKLNIRRGLIRPEDKAAARKAAKAGKTNGIGKKGEAPPLPSALVENLTAHRTAALQTMLAGNPKVALVAVVHALALDCLTTAVSASCVNVGAKTAYLAASAEGIDDGPAYKLFAATTKTATKGMPKQPEKLWAWLMAKDQKALLAILAVCAACTVDAVEKRRGADHGLDHAAQLAATLKLDMTQYWQPTAEGYFGRVSKALILEAVREGVGPGAAAKIDGLKKDAMAKRAEALLAGKGWLPALLR
jgi:ParB family transcriptional regulator, chromosome partitioning protein